MPPLPLAWVRTVVVALTGNMNDRTLWVAVDALAQIALPALIRVGVDKGVTHRRLHDLYILSAVALHARDDHGLAEIPAELVDQVRARISVA